MIKKLYIAECSNTYRQWIPQLLEGYFIEKIDLWESPEAIIDSQDAHSLMIVDEAFLRKGAGPARALIANLLSPQRILTCPMILLRRREALLNTLPHQVHTLRRPFTFEEIEKIIHLLVPEGRKIKELPMQSVSQEFVSSSNPQEAVQANSESSLNIEQITRETIEKVVREMLPSLAEKIIREEIARLTA